MIYFQGKIFLNVQDFREIQDIRNFSWDHLKFFSKLFQIIRIFMWLKSFKSFQTKDSNSHAWL